MASSSNQTPPKPKVTKPKVNVQEEEIKLYFQLKKTVAIKVKRSDTIKDLKVMIREKEGISEDLQELFFAGDRLRHDGFKVMDYGIPENSTVDVVHQESRMKLYFKMPSNEKIFQLEVQSSDTIQNIKSVIQAREGISANDYTIYYAGRLLQNDKTLASLRIKREATLQMISNPKEIVSIFVETNRGKPIQIEVRWTHTVLDVKKIVESVTSIPSEDCELLMGNEQLEDWKNLAYYDIKVNDILKMVRVRYQMPIKVPTGNIVTLEVTPWDTIRDIKEKFYQKTNVPIILQVLVSSGRCLDDAETLPFPRIRKDWEFLMMFRGVEFDIGPTTFLFSG